MAINRGIRCRHVPSTISVSLIFVQHEELIAARVAQLVCANLKWVGLCASSKAKQKKADCCPLDPEWKTKVNKYQQV